jgi:exonuclease SbcC
VLDLAPGVNVIVGASDSGKTAIIRALRWLIWNRPSGEAFRSTWGGPTSVQISLEDDDADHVVTRLKGDVNTYLFDDNIYKAFGADVPEYIRKVLNNIDETNLQMQLDAPFLISKSPGEVAAYFNRIAHLDQIDFGVKNVSSAIRTLTQGMEDDEKWKTTYEEELKTFEYLDKFEVDLEELETLNEKYYNLLEQDRRLTSLKNQVVIIEHDIEETSKVLVHESAVNYIFDVRELISNAREKQDTIRSKIEEIEEIEQEITVVEAEQALLPEIDALLKMYKEQQEIAGNLGILSNLCLTIKEVLSDIKTLDAEMNALEVDFHKHMPEQCPLCGK